MKEIRGIVTFNMQVQLLVEHYQLQLQLVAADCEGLQIQPVLPRAALWRIILLLQLTWQPSRIVPCLDWLHLFPHLLSHQELAYDQEHDQLLGLVYLVLNLPKDDQSCWISLNNKRKSAERKSFFFRGGIGGQFCPSDCMEQKKKHAFTRIPALMKVSPSFLVN